MLRVLDIFSGIGGFTLGLERTGGFRTVAFCEQDRFCRAVLEKHWPGVPKFRDVRFLERRKLANFLPIDVICGGFPCQDLSLAGKGAGIDGERSGLWKHYARLIGELRPSWAIVENVSALLVRGLGRVLGDLAEVGYDAEWHCIPASAVGAPHRRDRIWIVAYPERRLGPLEPHIAGMGRAQLVDPAAPSDTDSQGLPERGQPKLLVQLPAAVGSDWRLTEAPVCGADDGLSDRVDRISALGNAVVPQIPQIIGQAILEAMNMPPTDIGERIDL